MPDYEQTVIRAESLEITRIDRRALSTFEAYRRRLVRNAEQTTPSVVQAILDAVGAGDPQVLLALKYMLQLELSGALVEHAQAIAARTAAALGPNDPAATANLRALVVAEAVLALRQFGEAVTAMFETGCRSPVVLQTLYEGCTSRITQRVLRRVGAGTNGAGIHSLGDAVIAHAVKVFGESLNETLREWQRTLPVSTSPNAASGAEAERVMAELTKLAPDCYKHGFAKGREHERRTFPATAKQRRHMARPKLAS